MTDYKKQGKRNRAAGLRFERKVREDLEGRGWIVSKWHNNVDTKKEGTYEAPITKKYIVPAKPGAFRQMQTGFPDFVIFKKGELIKHNNYCILDDKFNLKSNWSMALVEAKKNGYLDKEERVKCKFLKDKGFDIFVASQDTDPHDKRKKVVKYRKV